MCISVFICHIKNRYSINKNTNKAKGKNKKFIQHLQKFEHYILLYIKIEKAIQKDELRTLVFAINLVDNL